MFVEKLPALYSSHHVALDATLATVSTDIVTLDGTWAVEFSINWLAIRKNLPVKFGDICLNMLKYVK